MLKSTRLFYILTGISCLLQLKTFAAPSSGDSAVIFIHLKLTASAPVTITPAPLKYNKHLAFSFTLDDGYRSAYLCAYPLLNGGRVSNAFPDEWKNDEGGDGQSSGGLFYSDGCGHNIPFRLALAINAANLDNTKPDRGHISPAEVQELYNAGWDILNHGYHHATKHGTDFTAEVQQNETAIAALLHFNMTQMVVPGGESDPGYEHEYERAAISNGHYAVASYTGAGPAIAVAGQVMLDSLIYARSFMQSHADSPALTAANDQLHRIDSLLQLRQPAWYNAFTHGVGNSNLWGLSVPFPEFRYFVTTLAGRYGSKGSDNIWMAPWQEVYEYLWVRQHCAITASRQGKEVAVRVAIAPLPANFRYHALSLLVSGSNGFTIAKQSGAGHVKAEGKKELINVSW